MSLIEDFLRRYIKQSSSLISFSCIKNKARIYFMSQGKNFSPSDKSLLRQKLDNLYMLNGSSYNVEWKPVRKESKLALKVRQKMDAMGIDYLWEIPCLTHPKYSYDYAFIHRGVFNSYIYFVEVDGSQHFVYTPYFHSTPNDYDEAVLHDKIKTKNACKLGYMIRIDNLNVDNCEQTFRKAIRKFFLTSPLTTTNDSRYKYLK